MSFQNASSQLHILVGRLLGGSLVAFLVMLLAAHLLGRSGCRLAAAGVLVLRRRGKHRTAGDARDSPDCCDPSAITVRYHQQGQKQNKNFAFDCRRRIPSSLRFSEPGT